ncbi:MAG: hypothetical protein QNI96_01625 [Woeseiaceae bacterium]|nr:hypothetical protein [Woeseiaceae bacterium]
MSRASQAILLQALFLLVHITYAADPSSEDQFDPGVSRLEALGVSDEPTIRFACGDEQEAIRLAEYVQSRIRAIVRVEKSASGVTYTFRRFDGDKEAESESRLVAASEWNSLIDGLEKDSFWINPSTVTTWRPDGLRWMFEACLSGRYRTHTLDPDFEFRMNELVEKLTNLRNAANTGSTP